MADSFHNYERKLQRRIERIRESDFTSSNKQAILGFVEHCFSRGLSVPRIEKYVNHLQCIMRYFQNDLEGATKQDIEKLVTTIERSDYAEWTKHDLRLTIKQFYRWLRGTGKDPPETEWIRLRCSKCKRMLPEELLTEDDISKLIDACQNARDKALVSVLYESGCRIGEIASVRIKHEIGRAHV
jgi:site-specific recombinase XerD